MKRCLVALCTLLALASCKRTPPGEAPTPGQAAAPDQEAAFVKLLLDHDDIDFVCDKVNAFIDSLSHGDSLGRFNLTLDKLEQVGAVVEGTYHVDLGGVFVALLDREYDLEFKRPPGQSGLVATLRTPGHTVQLAAAPDPPRNDYYAPPHQQPQEMTAETKALFGKPPTTFELVREAYTRQLKDYKCDPEHKSDAVKHAVLMNLKRGVFPGAGLSVHPDVGVEGSLLWLVEMPRGRVVKHEFWRDNTTYSVLYAAQSDRLYAETLTLLPAMAKLEDPQGKKQPPELIVKAAKAVAGDKAAAADLLKDPKARLTSESKAALR